MILHWLRSHFFIKMKLFTFLQNLLKFETCIADRSQFNVESNILSQYTSQDQLSGKYSFGSLPLEKFSISKNSKKSKTVFVVNLIFAFRKREKIENLEV